MILKYTSLYTDASIVPNWQDRSAAYEFLLAFRSNHGSISYSFRDFSRKSPIFPTPCILRPRLKRFHWNWVPALG